MFFICQLPVIAKGIGKNQFKRYLELFIDTIFYSLVRFISSFIFLKNGLLGEGRHKGLVPRNDVTVYYAKQAVSNF